MGPTTQQMGGVAAGSGGETGEMIISSGDSDALAGGGGGLKMSRGMVLGIILAVLVLVGGAVTWVVVSNLSNNGGGSTSEVITSAAEGYKGAFYKYANFIVNGTTSTDLLEGVYDPSEDYMYYSVLNDGVEYERQVSYLNEAQTLLDNFITEYQIAYPDVNIDDEYGNYIAAFNFVKTYVGLNFSEDDILKYYLDSDRNVELAKSRIYNALEDAVSDYGAGMSDYVEQANEYAGLMIDKYSEYNNSGCIANNKISASCAGAVTVNTEREARLAELGKNLQETIISNKFVVVTNCWAIEEHFNQGQDDE